ncbi:glycosyltransferase [Microbacterium sp.]|uniref:glycosyltransferase n=1 Tax=Microbacterium sp. TaxID=51671 RepID=UPI0025CC9D06|nr:glycosyltransferase [Microbacterium sp.]
MLIPPIERSSWLNQLPPGVPVRTAGVRQPEGVSAGDPRLIADASARLLAQAWATRLHPAFHRADLVDANTTRSAAYGALAARTSRVPFVAHLRDMVHADALGRVGFKTMRRVVLPRVDGVVTDTQATLDSALPYLRRDAVAAVIPSASGLRIREQSRPLPQGPLVVGMLARIDPWKGQALLVEAFARGLGETDARLQLAGHAYFGHEDHLAELKGRVVELGIADRVDFLGHVDDVESLLDTWHIAVQASTRAEPLGQNVLQYLAAGRVVIVADEGGPTEWVEHKVNGLRFSPRDSRQLAAALRELSGDEVLRSRLAAAAARTPGLLDDAEVASAHEAFYRQVCERRRG